MTSLVHIDDLDEAYRKFLDDNDIDIEFSMKQIVLKKHERGFEFNFEEFVCIIDAPPITPSFSDKVSTTEVVKVEKFKVYRDLMCEVPDFLKEYFL